MVTVVFYFCTIPYETPCMYVVYSSVLIMKCLFSDNLKAEPKQTKTFFCYLVILTKMSKFMAWIFYENYDKEIYFQSRSKIFIGF